ncbi:hypothetical protein PUN71_022225 [Arthrobacter sp. NQ7]|uniref:hypothetical protein n=1 Tax=Arthrobacter sp. NQ7 TaxID=3032303 RepID=UPI0024BBE827|nr:hypothetical protein [Arthrobacter sp. NQ7]MDJ0459928.1 hypothetical protein [Arthrobacter sp. NQ7]
MSRPETFTVVKQFVDGHDTARWFGVEVEFEVDGVVFCGKVVSYNGSPHARLEGVRAGKPD